MANDIAGEREVRWQRRILFAPDGVVGPLGETTAPDIVIGAGGVIIKDRYGDATAVLRGLRNEVASNSEQGRDERPEPEMRVMIEMGPGKPAIEVTQEFEEVMKAMRTAGDGGFRFIVIHEPSGTRKTLPVSEITGVREVDLRAARDWLSAPPARK